ncbi:hypothetical protein KOW79_014460 [Hemibagrus wyckioides]|uniref:Nitric oxide synthase, inducible n=1 Tax=Hemibagrus wyckioides TaxID=337641 RepID=A0A9D3NIV1_9TELE|nr:hypothetical protein KOW79_014460 [Hemibagrus wyckioides]
MKLKGRKSLQSAESRHSTLLIELQGNDEKEALNYESGDHVGVFPGNPPELVMGILKHLTNTPPINQTI